MMKGIIEYVLMVVVLAITICCTVLFRFIDNCHVCYIATMVLLPINLILIITVCIIMCCCNNDIASN